MGNQSNPNSPFVRCGLSSRMTGPLGGAKERANYANVWLNNTMGGQKVVVRPTASTYKSHPGLPWDKLYNLHLMAGHFEFRAMNRVQSLQKRFAAPTHLATVADSPPPPTQRNRHKPIKPRRGPIQS